MSSAGPYTDAEIEALRVAPTSPYGVTDSERIVATVDALRAELDVANAGRREFIRQLAERYGRSDELTAAMVLEANQRGLARFIQAHPDRESWPGTEEMFCWLMSDMERTRADARRYREALEWYADDESYAKAIILVDDPTPPEDAVQADAWKGEDRTPSASPEPWGPRPVLQDKGERARTALGDDDAE